MNTQTIALDVSKRPKVAPVLHIRHGDKNATTLEAAMFDNGAPLDLAGYSVELCMALPDGESSYEVTGTASGNEATFAIDETDAAAYVGRTALAYVEVIGNDTICSTGAFTVIIEPGARG